MATMVNMSGKGSSKAIINLLQKLEENLYGLKFQKSDDDFFSNMHFKFELIQKINVEYGQEEERTSQESFKKKSKDQTGEGPDRSNSREDIDASITTDGRQRSGSSTISDRISEFSRSLRSDFDRQYIHRRKDGKLVVQIFEYFKYLDLNVEEMKIDDTWVHNPYHVFDLNYHICSHKREGDDLILIIDHHQIKNFQIQTDKMLFYPLLDLDVFFNNGIFKLTNKGFYIKWEGML